MCSLVYLRLLVLMFSAQRLLLVTEEIWPNAGNVKRSFANKGLWKKDTRNIIAAKSSPCHVTKSYNEEIWCKIYLKNEKIEKYFFSFTIFAVIISWKENVSNMSPQILFHDNNIIQICA